VYCTDITAIFTKPRELFVDCRTKETNNSAAFLLKNVTFVASVTYSIYLQCKNVFAGLTRASLLKGLEEILVVINVSECRLCRVTKILALILQIPSAYYKEVKTRIKMINTGQKMVILLCILLYYYTIKMFRKLLCIF
jgi:hypothetical protein